MSDGIQWLVGLDNWLSGVVFVRGISAQELALRMGADAEGGTEPITDAQAWGLEMEGYRPGGDGDGVVRVGECAGWSFALEYGDSTGRDLLAEISRNGAEAVRYAPMPDHPPATVDYARDGVVLCSFGLAEENWRYGKEPDLLNADLIAGQVLSPDGRTLIASGDGEDDEDFRVTYRRTLGVVEQRFGLSLPRACLEDGRLPAYAVRGTRNMRI